MEQNGPHRGDQEAKREDACSSWLLSLSLLLIHRPLAYSIMPLHPRKAHLPPWKHHHFTHSEACFLNLIATSQSNQGDTAMLIAIKLFWLGPNIKHREILQ